jgi:hypothetical protein
MTTQTTVNNKFIDNTVEVHRSDAGNTVETEVINSDNGSTSSRALIKIETGGASGGDPAVVFSTGATNFSLGMDNSDSDSFVFSENAALGTTNVGKCYTTGEWIYPLNAAFEADADNVAQNNITGFAYTSATPALGTERLDIGSDYNTGTYTFTIPQDGIYLIATEVRCKGTTAAQLMDVYIDGSNPWAARCNRASTSVNIGRNLIAAIEYDAADTVYITIQGYGEASNVWDLVPDFGRSYFQGALVS